MGCKDKIKNFHQILYFYIFLLLNTLLTLFLINFRLLNSRFKSVKLRTINNFNNRKKLRLTDNITISLT